ncbi:cation:dicarboxylase symporter family transporter [Sphingomonas sp. BIUV-7]|uniref:Cation:dicarboxylase symporter family transporter n=1 Tax=Sphingomonas natans TaxID=3063330 RepID=A0ABT8Y8M7_9SPHN|nr:cation:dicarboxylase symporter family transporter [Sphingomonas sp. BIUV-7]MDO6414327.1 cation:dicarboxylase symporter family transporter [Sphingomonas sp. BIUV-7]
MAGLAIGLAAGMTLSGSPQKAIGQILLPLGSLWLDALTMTVVPLVFGLLVVGVASASRSAAAGGTATRALAIFALMLAAACLSAAFLAEGLLQLWPVAAANLNIGGGPAAVVAPATWYHSIIPPNPIKAAAETAMVPLVVFALFCGFATARLEPGLAEALLQPLRALVEAMLVIVSWVLAAGPIGIAALAFGAGARLGTGVFGALGQYVVVVAACCLAATLLAYGWVAAIGSRSPLKFARAAMPAQAVALGTQSSLATLPVMIEAVGSLGLRRETTGIVLPMAVSLFRAASAAANVAVAVYLSHVYHVPMGVGGLVLAAAVAVPVSLGAVGLPAQVSFFATIAPVCIAIGVPVMALPLLLAIESIPDLFRTLGNVTNDMAAAVVAERWAPPERATGPTF